jgi:hypothetical protein
MTTNYKAMQLALCLNAFARNIELELRHLVPTGMKVYKFHHAGGVLSFRTVGQVRDKIKTIVRSVK